MKNLLLHLLPLLAAAAYGFTLALLLNHSRGDFFDFPILLALLAGGITIGYYLKTKTQKP